MLKLEWNTNKTIVLISRPVIVRVTKDQQLPKSLQRYPSANHQKVSCEEITNNNKQKVIPITIVEV